MQNTKDIGSKIRHVEKGSLPILTEIFTKENGKMTRPMGMDAMYILMGLNMKDSGKMIYKKGMELNYGWMDRNMKGFIRREGKMDKGRILGLIDLLILGFGKIIK